MIWTCEYNANVLPENATPDWYRELYGTATAEIVGGALHITARGEGNALWYGHNPPRGWIVDPAVGFTIEARIRVVAPSKQSGVSIVGRDSIHDVYLLVEDNQLVTADKTYTIDATNWHIYRITFDGSTEQVYADGNLVMRSGVWSSDQNWTGFGRTGAGAGKDGEAYYDYIKYYVDGPVAPPTCPDPIPSFSHSGEPCI